MYHKKWLILVIGLIAAFALGCSERTSFPRAERVVLIGIDGVGTEALKVAQTPNLDRLIREGCLSLKARGVMPTVSGPNWSSMLCGAGPEQHGITSNGWLVNNHTIEPAEADEDGYFPSIFTLLARQRPDVKTAMFYDWDHLGMLFNHKWITKIQFTRNAEETIKQGIPFVLENTPSFTFMYFGLPDEEGHAHGFASPEHYQAISHIDSLMGVLLKKLDESGLTNQTHIVVISDHGGVGKGHGGESMTEIQVPWIVFGPGVRKNYILEKPMNSLDSAPTIAALFGVKTPDSWVGKPVAEAFE